MAGVSRPFSVSQLYRRRPIDTDELDIAASEVEGYRVAIGLVGRRAGIDESMQIVDRADRSYGLSSHIPFVQVDLVASREVGDCVFTVAELEVERVIAAAAGQDVVPASAADLVVTSAAEDDVVATLTAENVIPCAANEEIVVVSTHDFRSTSPSKHLVVARSNIDQVAVLAAEDCVVRGIAVDMCTGSRLVAEALQRQGVTIGAILDDQIASLHLRRNIGAAEECHQVRLRRNRQLLVTHIGQRANRKGDDVAFAEVQVGDVIITRICLEEKFIRPVAARENIISSTAVKHIIPSATEKDIIAYATIKRVVTSAAVEKIVSSVTAQSIIANAAENDVVAVTRLRNSSATHEQKIIFAGAIDVPLAVGGDLRDVDISYGRNHVAILSLKLTSSLFLISEHV